ncbi:hypothetical protein QMK33_19205 [Hymenobacter sp. H14-R3]|uniref:hypothetical protein n=1 Tax=Hymenobacter sp. H14-R3 TaxID=3046308 RepID=UPI0024BB8F6B|nr:hypothetical protein [Hymenobacter sp. H14-R3]MDJ0367281.1 hypothetical protein [Hymenobacter sp. H14-R3]
MAKKKDAPIGFGRKPMPDEAGDTEQAAGPPERQLGPPLVEPKAIDDVMMYKIFTRYNLQPLLPPAKFEYQLVEIIAALEERVRELDPDL